MSPPSGKNDLANGVEAAVIAGPCIVLAATLKNLSPLAQLASYPFVFLYGWHSVRALGYLVLHHRARRRPS